jgi:hypothetical protein
MAARKSLTGGSFVEGKPKRTRIGNGRRVRTIKVTGRTKRSSGRKIYRGQGK